ncbi:hypothetical protein GN956_G15754, partial [Arapaima gigas]
LYCKEIHFGVLQVTSFLPILRPPVGEKDETIRFCRAEVERYGAHTLGVPLGEAEVGLRCLKRDRVQGGYILAFKHHVTLNLHLGIRNPGQPREF